MAETSSSADMRKQRAGFRKNTTSAVTRLLQRTRETPRHVTRKLPKQAIASPNEWEDVEEEPAGVQTRKATKSAQKSKASPQDAVPPHDFMHLPLELRDKVYAHLMSNLPTDVTLFHADKGPILTYLPKDALPSLAYTNHQLYNEVALVYIRRTRFIISARHKLQLSRLFDFLNHFLNEQGFRNVRSLMYQDNLTCFTSPDAPLALGNKYKHISCVVMRCTGLKELNFTIYAQRLIVYNRHYDWNNIESNTGPRYKRVQTPFEVNERLQLARIVEHQGAFKLRIVCRAMRLVSGSAGVAPRELLLPFMKALENHIVQSGSKITLQVLHDMRLA